MNQSRATDYEVKLLVNPVNILTSFVTVIMNKMFLIIIMNVIKKTNKKSSLRFMFSDNIKKCEKRRINKMTYFEYRVGLKLALPQPQKSLVEYKDFLYDQQKNTMKYAHKETIQKR